jgi:hypothetical protein
MRSCVQVLETVGKVVYIRPKVVEPFLGGPDPAQEGAMCTGLPFVYALLVRNIMYNSIDNNNRPNHPMGYIYRGT